MEKFLFQRRSSWGISRSSRPVFGGLLLIFLFHGVLGGCIHSAQGQGVGPISSTVSVFGAGSSTAQVPSWLDANQFGRFDREGTTLGARLAARRPSSGTDDGLDYSVGGTCWDGPPRTARSTRRSCTGNSGTEEFS